MKELESLLMSFGYILGFILFFIFIGRLNERMGADVVRAFSPGLLLFALPFCIVIGMAPFIPIMIHMEVVQKIKDGASYIGYKRVESSSEFYIYKAKQLFLDEKTLKIQLLEQEISDIKSKRSWLGLTKFQQKMITKRQKEILELANNK